MFFLQDAKRGNVLIPPSPLHSGSNFDIYAGLDDNALSESEGFSRSCRPSDHRVRFSVFIFQAFLVLF